ncbi:sensor histidine kinase [Bacillus suaedaesalsae]|uniref:histidine kinase n=1 Tax=Bacillus suaedaesalsae TaxID=2810349 RepID=A0ABS2DF38_9BACI|nr:HAMP domain-containing sensor histidine kinase [Bacillus suaedaesalsae]MBM6617026.1 ATP-binding protein [Bacillus suaedaesalsae]
MLAEKLLLHVLIILTPVLIHYVFFEDKGLKKSPYIIGILHGTASFLCMIFANFSYGLYWDLRYTPLVLASLYGGPISGFIVLIFIFATRTLLGGDTILFGYISASLAAIVPLLFSKGFLSIKAKKRVASAVLIGFWPAVIQLGILLAYLTTVEIQIIDRQEMILYISLFGIIQLVGIGFAATLYEAMLEKQQMKEEITRNERISTLGELAASIAHEVRNPLTVVKGFLQLMKENNKDQGRNYFPLVLGEIDRAESIISDYLNFAKPQLERIEKFCLSDIIRENVALIAPFANKQGVELYGVIEDEIWIETDKNKFKQALINFIKNAIEASSDKGKVSITLSKEHTSLKLIVKDNGKGMTKEQLDRIGTLYYTTKEKGTGLGTTVSIRIIEAMNGSVHYKSNVGAGTEVMITLPSCIENS